MTRTLAIIAALTTSLTGFEAAHAQPRTPADLFEIAGIKRGQPAQLDAVLPATIPAFGKRIDRYRYPRSIGIQLSANQVISWSLDAAGAQYLADRTNDATLRWLLAKVYGEMPTALHILLGKPTETSAAQHRWRTTGPPATILEAHLDGAGRVQRIAVLDSHAVAANERSWTQRARLAAQALAALKPYPPGVTSRLRAACLRRATAPRTVAECDCVVGILPGVAALTTTWGDGTRKTRGADIDRTLALCTDAPP